MAKRTALVTGASSGIGHAFAAGLAARDHDLVVAARDTARLDQVAAELASAHGASVEVLGADLSTEDGVTRVAARLRADPPVDVLVNNAGFGTHGRFHEMALERELDEINLNVVALVRLCHAALPGMVRRRRGGVINVSSIAGYQPNPQNATYGATKAYVSSFSQALHEEVRRAGVNVMVLCPGFTRTEFQDRAGIDSSRVPGALWHSAEEVVAAALRAYDKGRAVCVPGALNRTAAAVSATLPSALTRRIAQAVISRSE